MVRFDLTLGTDTGTHLVMQFSVRVRDHRHPGIVVRECLNEDQVLTPTLEECMALQVFSPVSVAPPPPMMP